MKNHSSAVRSLARSLAMLTLNAVSLLALIMALSPVAAAADNIWTGGAGTGNFSDNANWQSPPSWGFGNSLIFSTNTNAPTLTNDYGGWRDNNDIYWDTTFLVARTLQSTGDFGINFKLRLENKSSFAQTVTMPLSGGKNGAGGIQLNPVNGSLILSGTIYNDSSVDYSVFGSETATVTNLTLNTALGPNATQTNVDFVVAGGRNSAIQVNASQLWAGTTDVQSGSFTTANGVTLASTAILVSGGTVATTSANTFADSASLTVNTGRLSIGGSDTVASLAGSGGTVDLAAGATLTFGGSGTSSYAGAITGAGNLTKVGSGTFTLSAASSMTGTTTVSAGQFSLGGSNLLADTSAVAVTGGVLALGGSSDTVGTFAISGGSLTGSGTLTAANYSLGGGTVSANLGSGTMSVTGNTSLNGTWAGGALGLASGALTLGSANALGSTGTISFNGGTLQYSASNTTDYSGRFSTASSQQYRIDTNGQSVTLGSSLASPGGSLAKLGGGALTLSGSNSFGGGVAIDAGTLALASAGALGTTGTISFGGGTLQYVSNNTDYSDRFSTAAGQQYRIDTGEFYVFLASNLTSAGGSLAKFGAGFLNLTGTNTYSGGTVVAGGSLIGTPDSLQGAITNNAQVIFVDGGTYAGVISGSGAVEVQNSGSLRFTAANTYTGTTFVSGGGFRLDGSIAGELLVNAIGTLSGTGTVGGNAVIGGVHSPGNSPGIQTFNGDLTYQGDENVPQVDWELITNTTGSAGVSYDQIVMPTGNLDFANTTMLSLSFDATGSSVLWSNAFWDVNRSWMIYDLSGGTTNNIGNLTVGGSLLDSLGNSLSPTGRGYFTTSLAGQDVMLNFVAVPEPSTWATSIAALICGGYARARRPRRA